jgi:hypothetical protein
MRTSPIECDREDEVLMIVSTGRWPKAAPVELREHADHCQVCRELGLAAASIGDETEVSLPNLPSSGTVWWRAQLRARQEAARQVVRPITAVQMLAFAAIVGVAGAVFGATTQWFQRGLRTLARTIAEGAGSIPLPSVPMPQDLSTVPVSSWIIVVVAGLGLIAGAAVVSWAMKEE